jgi:hypothetical protein
MRGTGGILIGIAAALALVAPGAAQANTKTVGDGNDTANALDIRSVSHGHKRARLTHTLRTYSRFSARFLRGDNGILFGFDTNGSARSAERFAVIFWAGGRLHAVVVNGKGHFVAKARVSRPSSRSVKVTLRRSSLGNPAGYRWTGFTFVGQSVDVAPNRGLILHDITAPQINFPRQPIPADTTYNVTFSVSDSGGAGLKEWRLQRRTFGTSSWSTYATGGGGGSHAVSVTAAQGDDDQYRVVAIDRQQNKQIGPIRTVSIPIDDTNTTAISYAGSWNPPATGIVGAFLETLTSPVDSSATFSYSFAGTYVALIGPGNCATGTVTIDGVQDSLDEPCNDGQRRVLYRASLATGDHTLVLGNVGSGFSLDGIITR